MNSQQNQKKCQDTGYFSYRGTSCAENVLLMAPMGCAVRRRCQWSSPGPAPIPTPDKPLLAARGPVPVARFTAATMDVSTLRRQL